MVAALTAPTINAADVETLRKQSMAIADKIVGADHAGDGRESAQVLTPEQRKLAQAEIAKRRSSSLRPALGVTFVDVARMRRAKARPYPRGFPMC